MAPLLSYNDRDTRTFPTFLVLLVTLTTTLQVNGETILITDTLLPIAATKDIRVITLDTPATLEGELSVHLPADPAQAQRIFAQRMTPEVAAQLTQAHQNVTDAWSMGVTKVPAVVVDRKYVIYGETNVQRAFDRIEEYRRKEQ
jgi:integrating conjugative element protein (TIGR03757 family)